MGGHADQKHSDDPPPDVRAKASEVLGASNMAVDIYNSVKEHELELNRATAAFEHAALKPSVLLNGGAATAFVTLFGAVKGGESFTIDSIPAILAICVWTFGLIAAASAIGFGWHSQRSYTRYMKRQRAALEYHFAGMEDAATEKTLAAKVDAKQGKRSQYAAVALGASTYLAFVLGVIAAMFSVF